MQPTATAVTSMAAQSPRLFFLWKESKPWRDERKGMGGIIYLPTKKSLLLLFCSPPTCLKICIPSGTRNDIHLNYCRCVSFALQRIMHLTCLNHDNLWNTVKYFEATRLRLAPGQGCWAKGTLLFFPRITDPHFTHLSHN